MGAAPAPDFRLLPFRVDAEGKAPTEINNVEDLLLEPAMGVEHLVVEGDRLETDVGMAVDVVAGAEVHLRAPVTAKRSAAKLHQCMRCPKATAVLRLHCLGPHNPKHGHD